MLPVRPMPFKPKASVSLLGLAVTQRRTVWGGGQHGSALGTSGQVGSVTCCRQPGRAVKEPLLRWRLEVRTRLGQDADLS